MTALDRQVGGDHYKDLAIQPVEFAMVLQLGFCEGCIVKYVTRWRAKGGIEDVRKASHFLQFIEESSLYRSSLQQLRSGQVPLVDSPAAGDRYCESNDLSNPEAGVIRHITWWAASGAEHELKSARKWMQELMELAIEQAD
ncbi:MAG: hypothetical protein Hals2KO_21380 [Halioglobus sp.]